MVHETNLLHPGLKHEDLDSAPAACRGLQRPLCHPPEQLPSLLGRHGVAALQQVGDDERLLDGGGLHPHSTVHPHHQLTGEELLQVGQDLAVGGQQPGGVEPEDLMERPA